jgi:MFS family permease
MENKRLAPGIVAIQFLVLISYSSVAILTLLSLYFEHLGGSPRQIGFLMGLFSLAGFLSRPFGGWLLARIDPRKVVATSLVLLVLITALYLFIRELDWYAAFVRAIHGFTFSVFILAALLIAVLLSSEKERAYAIGVVSTGFMLPLLFAPFIGEVVIKKFGYFPFFLTAILFAAIPLAYYFFTRIEIPRFLEESKVRSTGYLRLLLQRRIYSIFFLSFVFEVGLSSSLAFVPLLTQGKSSMRAGFFYTFLGLTAVLMRVYGGSRFKFWGSPRLLLPAFYFLAGGGILTYLASNDFLLALSAVIWGIGTGILYPHLTALVVEGVPSRDRGKVLSLFASSVDLGFALGPLSFGALSNSLGFRNTFLLLALFIFLSSTGLVWIGRPALFKVKVKG